MLKTYIQSKYVRGGVRCAVNIAIFCVGGKFTIVGFALSLVEAKYGELLYNTIKQ